MPVTRHCHRNPSGESETKRMSSSKEPTARLPHGYDSSGKHMANLNRDSSCQRGTGTPSTPRGSFLHYCSLPLLFTHRRWHPGLPWSREHAHFHPTSLPLSRPGRGRPSRIAGLRSQGRAHAPAAARSASTVVGPAIAGVGRGVWKERQQERRGRLAGCGGETAATS